MNNEIISISYKDIPDEIKLHKEIAKNCITISNRAKYYGYIMNGDIVAIGGYVQYKNYSKILASFTLPEYRNKGIYTKILEVRLKLLKDYDIITFATKHSLNVLLNHGFEIIKTYKISYKLKLTR